MNEEVYVCLIRGYHKESEIPSIALKRDFVYRFALVFDTISQKFSSPHFPSVFFAELLGRISLECGYTNLLVQTETIQRKLNPAMLRMSSSNEFSIFAEEKEPPLHMEFFNESGLACIMESEMWVYAGGELPYADSYTISFYTPIEMYEKFSRVCIKHCSEKHATILEQIEASQFPIPTPWWKRLFE